MVQSRIPLTTKDSVACSSLAKKRQPYTWWCSFACRAGFAFLWLLVPLPALLAFVSWPPCSARLGMCSPWPLAEIFSLSCTVRFIRYFAAASFLGAISFCAGFFVAPCPGVSCCGSPVARSSCWGITGVGGPVYSVTVRVRSPWMIYQDFAGSGCRMGSGDLVVAGPALEDGGGAFGVAP